MKKILAILFTLAMMTAFTGCKGDSPSEKAAKEADKAIEEAKELFK
jgi:hypothetical protein